MKARLPVVSKVNGVDVNFYGLPVGVLCGCRVLSDSMSTLIANIFADTSKDVDNEVLTVPMNMGEGKEEAIYMSTEKSVKAISPSMATLRIQQKKEGIKELINAVSSKDTQELLAKAVVKSAKEENLDIKELIDGDIDAESFVELVMGTVAANKGVFGRMGKWLSLLKPEGAEGLKETLKVALTPTS
jgi:hypothetical protein